jgi:hypothetical protein
MNAIVKIFKALFGGILGLFAKKEGGFQMDAGPAENAPAVAAALATKAVVKAAEPATKDAKKATGKAAKATKPTAKTAVAAAVKAPVTADPLDLINAALEASKVATEEAQAVVGSFADKYLIANPMPTRRPGANMAMFKDMAKSMKRF